MTSMYGIVLLENLQHLDAADAGQADVQHHEVDGLLLHDLQRSLARRHPQNAVVLAQDRGHRLAHPFVVVDDEERLAAFGHGDGEYTNG